MNVERMRRANADKRPPGEVFRVRMPWLVPWPVIVPKLTHERLHLQRLEHEHLDELR